MWEHQTGQGCRYSAGSILRESSEAKAAASWVSFGKHVVDTYEGVQRESGNKRIPNDILDISILQIDLKPSMTRGALGGSWTTKAHGIPQRSQSVSTISPTTMYVGVRISKGGA